MSESSGGEFLNFKYPDLQKSEQIKKSVDKKQRIEGIKTPNNPTDRNEVFLDRLENIFNNPNQNTKDRNIELFKNKFLYPSVLVDKDNLPNSYFELQQRIARERGHGNVYINEDTKAEMGRIVYDDQKKSLDVWIDYLSDKQTDYPSWFKYFTLRNVTKMGNYDKEKKEFSKRTKSTTNIFPDLNREALSYTYDVLEQRYLKHQKLDNKELNKILDSANFSKIYAFAIDKVTPASKENKEKTEGEWTKFIQGDDATALYESLQSHGTGWCTAGQETAKMQLETGDFYVYYTKDENNKNTIPRIAIRMKQGQVAEVRGIAADQNLEGNMMDIAKEKYHQLPGGEKFDKIDHDMKLLTLIDKKTKNSQELNEGEIIFLYELKGFAIQNFGFGPDWPRIQEIRSRIDSVALFNFNKLTNKVDQQKACSYLAENIHNKIISKENPDKVLNFIIEKGGDMAASNLIGPIINKTLSGENLDKAWKFIFEKGDNNTTSELARHIHRGAFSEENLDKLLNFIFEKGGDEDASYLTGAIANETLSGENLDKAWKFIFEKGDKITASDLPSSIGYLHDENLNKAWKFIFEKGDEITALNLIFYFDGYDNKISGKNLDKALNFIFEKGGAKAASKLSHQIATRALSGENLDKVKAFIESHRIE